MGVMFCCTNFVEDFFGEWSDFSSAGGIFWQDIVYMCYLDEEKTFTRSRTTR